MRAAIVARQEAVEWLIKHDTDLKVDAIKRSLSKSPDLEKKLTLVLHGRLEPRDFYFLCRSWQDIRNHCRSVKDQYSNRMHSAPLLASLLDAVIHSLREVDNYLKLFDESMALVGDKTRLFNDLSDYPKMLQAHQQFIAIENQLEDLKTSIGQTLALAQVDYVTVSGAEYLIQVKNDQLPAVPDTWTKING